MHFKSKVFSSSEAFWDKCIQIYLLYLCNDCQAMIGWYRVTWLFIEMTMACPGTIDWSIVTHDDYRLVNSLRDVNYRLVNSLRDVTKSWRHQVMHAADWFKHHIFYPSSPNIYPIWKIKKLTGSIINILKERTITIHPQPLFICS